MSTGFGGKGKDGKYNTLNLAAYKGRSAESKSSGAVYRHGGYQSLGKVPATRRVPPPASLPSLKSENLGNDPNISLVPKDGSGWASKSETPPTCIVQSRPSPQQPVSSSYSHPPASCPVTSTNTSNRSGQRWSSTVGSTQQHQQTWASSARVTAGKKMSGAAGGDPVRGTIPSSEDFPILGGFQKDGTGNKSKDLQYGIGQNLRPQNVSSWKSGVGKNFMPPEDERGHHYDENKNQFYTSNSESFDNNSVDYQQYQHRNSSERFNDTISAPHMSRDERYPPAPTVLRRDDQYSYMNNRRNDEGNWAAMHPEVDYAEKLVFSDDEEPRRKGESLTSHTNHTNQENKPENSYGKKDVRSVEQRSSSSPGRGFNQQQAPTQAWASSEHGPHYSNRSSHTETDIMRSHSGMRMSSQRQQQHRGHVDDETPPAAVYSSSSGLLNDNSPSSFLTDNHPSKTPASYNSDSSSQRGSKNEKEEAVERARKRREEEEMRMERRRLEASGGSGGGQQWFGHHGHSKARYDISSYGRVPGDGYDRIPGTVDKTGGSLRQNSDNYRGFPNDQREEPGHHYQREMPQHPNILKRNRSNSDNYGNQTPRSTDYEFSQESSISTMSEKENSKICGENDPYKTHHRDNSCSLKDSTTNTSKISQIRPQSSSHSFRSTGGLRMSENDSEESSSSQQKNTSSKPQTQQPLPARRLDRVKLRDFRADADEGESVACPTVKFPTKSEHSSKSKNGSSAAETVSKHSSNEKKPWSTMVKQSSEDSSDKTTASSDNNNNKDSTYNRPPSTAYYNEEDVGEDESIKSATFNNRQSPALTTQSSSIERSRGDDSRNHERSRNIHHHHDNRQRLRHEQDSYRRPRDGQQQQQQQQQQGNYHQQQRPNSNKRSTGPTNNSRDYQQPQHSSYNHEQQPRRGHSGHRGGGVGRNFKNDNGGRDRKSARSENNRDSDHIHDRRLDTQQHSDSRHPESIRHDDTKKGGFGRYEGKNRHGQKKSKGDQVSVHFDDSCARTKGDESNDELDQRRPPLIKQTPAAPPSTNVWEERAKKQQQQVPPPKDELPRTMLPLTFIPKEEDKKRTLKETAPVKKAEKARNDTESERGSTSSPVAGPIPKNPGSGKRQNSSKFNNNSFGGETHRRTSSPQSTFQQPRPLRDPYDSAERKRGRGRSRGGGGGNSYSSGRGGGYVSINQAGQTSRGRGRRGTRHSSSPLHNNRGGLVPSQGRYHDQHHHPSSRNSSRMKGGDGKGEMVGSMTTDETFLSDNNDTEVVGRRRQLGENSDAECLSSYVSNSDQEHEDGPKFPTRRSFKARGGRNQPPTSNNNSRYNNSNNGPTRAAAGDIATGGGGNKAVRNDKPAFTARGAPSRRGRGGFNRGQQNSGGGRSRGGGYKSSHGGGSDSGSGAPTPSGSTTSSSAQHHHQRAVENEGGGGKREDFLPPRNLNSSGGRGGGPPDSDGRRDPYHHHGGHHGGDTRPPRKKRGNDRPPRFNNFNKQQQQQYDNNSQGSLRKGAPGNNLGRRHSTTGPDEWETASDHSNEIKKSTASRGGYVGKGDKSEMATRKGNSPSAARGGGSHHGGHTSSSNRRGGGGSGRGSHHGGGSSHRRNANSSGGQVFMLHSVKYNDPSAVAGALAGGGVAAAAAASSNKNSAKLEREQQERNRDLFQKYDLHNYARVVNVDDIPQVSGQNEAQSGHDTTHDMMDKHKDLQSNDFNALMTSSGGVMTMGDDDDDGFTPVLSKRQQKKLHEEKKKETLKQEQVAEALEILKKAAAAHRLSRSKAPHKASITPGASGGVRHASPSTINCEKQLSKEIWNSKIKSLSEKAKELNGEGKASPTGGDSSGNKSVSQHDSGVDSSIPSSQRSSPGTDAKLNFNQLAASVAASATATPISSQQQQTCEGANKQHITKEITEEFHLIESSKPKDSLNLLKVVDPYNSTRPGASNGIGAIGNERMKISTTKYLSPSVENITMLFSPCLNDKMISFIAETSSADDPQVVATGGGNVFSGGLTSNFKPFSEHCGEQIGEKQEMKKAPAELDPNDEMKKQDTSSNKTSLLLDSKNAALNNENENFLPISSQPQRDYDEAAATIDVANSEAGEGVKVPKNESSKDMPLNPQTTSNQATGHKNAAVDTCSNIPPPLPLSAASAATKHSTTESPGADGDRDNKTTAATATGLRQSCEVVNPNANGGAGDGMSLTMKTPTSPSVEMDLKMESARKAWENMPSDSSSIKVSTGKSDSNIASYYHPTANTLSNSIGNENAMSNMPEATLKDGQTTDWQTTTHANNTPSSMAENEGSWRDSQQQNIAQCVSSATNSAQQPDPVQESVQNSSSNKIQDVQISSGQYTNSPTGNNTNSIETTANAHLMTQYENNGSYMYLLDNNSQYMPTQSRVSVQPLSTQQSQQLYQSVSSSALATNLHQIQQQTYAPNPAYNSSMGIQPSAQPGFNSQAREFTPMMAMNTTTMNNPAANMGQQNNMNSQYAMHRPHNGAPSPHGTVLIPVESRTLMPSSQSNALINQQISRSQSSYHSQSANSNYFSQQPTTHLPNQQYQTPIHPFHPRQMFPVKAMSPAMGLEHMTIGPPSGGSAAVHQNQMYTSNQQTANTPASVQPRLRMDGSTEYSPHQSQQYASYYTKHHPIAAPTMMNNKNINPNIPATLQGNASQSYEQQQQQLPAAVKHNNQPAMVAAGGYNNMKFAPGASLYPFSSKTPDNMQGNHFGNKYDNSPVAAAVQQQPKPPYHHPSPSAVGGLMQANDWSKHTSSSQPRPSHIPPSFSRPYSSTNDTVYQQPSSMKSNFKPIDTQNAFQPQQGSYAQQQQPRFDHNSVSTWNPQTKQLAPPHSNVGGGSQSSQMSILGKPPTRPIMNAPMMNPPRFQMPNFQQQHQQMQSNNMNTAYQTKPQMNTRMQQSSVNPYINSDKSRQSPAIPSQYVNNQQNNKVQKQQMPQQQGNKPNKQQQQLHPGLNSSIKSPPVPTLVRGGGSTLAGKKPTHLPEEVVKSNQANERASLLQSLSSLLTDKPIIPDPISGDGGTDWSTKVANSSPLPQRKPGMRHPGVEKFSKDPAANRPGRSGGGDNGGRNRRGRGGRKSLPNPISTHNAIDMMDNNTQQQQQQQVMGQQQQQQQVMGQQQQQVMGLQAAAAASAAAALAASKAAAKKLTLADTKPKKGEVSNINIRETSAVGGVVAPAGGGITMVKPPSATSDVVGVGNDV